MGQPKKLMAIRGGFGAEKELRPFGDWPIELQFAFYFQQSGYGGWGRARNGYSVVNFAGYRTQEHIILVIALFR